MKKKQEPCPKWNRHKWSKVGPPSFTEDGDLKQRQQCLFCFNERLIDVPEEQDEDDEE